MMEEFQDFIGLAVSGKTFNQIQLLIMEAILMTSSFLLLVEKDGDLWSMHLATVQLILMVGIAINFSGTQNTFNVISMYSYLEFL